MIFWIILVTGGLIVLWLKNLNKDYYVMAFFAKRIKTVDGSPIDKILPIASQKTIFGNTFDLAGLSSEGMFMYSREVAKELRQSYAQYMLGVTIYNIITAEDAEYLMNDVNLITKNIVYNFLEPFLHTGLLTSTDKKWHERRKMLTPAFHFNILEQFEEIFKEESKKFVQRLHNNVDEAISLAEVIPNFTLNNVCETALGVKLDDCLEGDNYRKSIGMIEECFVKRLPNPFYMNDTLFNFLEGNKYKPHLKVVHEFSSEIIEKRRRLFKKEPKNKHDTQHYEFDMKKKRYAMLDTLLMAESDGLIDHYGICEEVDTFMFEGFDTTSMGLTFGLMNLSLYQDMQERCYQEILENIDDDLDHLCASQLNKLKYLECFLKESLRMYPPVPVIGRKAVREAKLGNNVHIPEGAQIVVHIFDIHRDPAHFENPDNFDPERFTPENSVGRHPYAYIPFSAGQRNCIGQKFAMLEMKTLLVHVIKNFQILPMMDAKDFTFSTGIIIRTPTDIKIKLIKRV